MKYRLSKFKFKFEFTALDANSSKLYALHMYTYMNKFKNK